MMNNPILDRKYISLISSRLIGFQWKSPSLINSRCLLCGDSKTNMKRKRFFIYMKNGSWICHCHNCSYHKPFWKFLERIDGSLYQEYKLELITELHETEADLSQFKVEPPRKNCWDAYRRLRKISSLDYNHPAKKYIVKRQTPNPFHAEFRWCPNFMTWINHIIPDKFSQEALKNDEGRILIPFFAPENKYLFACQGRSIDPKQKERYISIQFDSDYPLVWGLDRIDLKQDVWSFEGVMDAVWIPNSTAFCGSNLTAVRQKIKDPIIVYDNERRSSETKRKISRAIDQGLRVVIWPDNMLQKDVNEMIIAGMDTSYIEWLMKVNTFKDLEARFRLEEWSKR